MSNGKMLLEVEFDSHQWLVLRAALDSYIARSNNRLRLARKAAARDPEQRAFADLYEEQGRDARILRSNLEAIYPRPDRDASGSESQ